MILAGCQNGALRLADWSGVRRYAHGSVNTRKPSEVRTDPPSFDKHSDAVDGFGCLPIADLERDGHGEVHR